MPQKPKQKMSIEVRAKQFMPFAALTGLDEALRKAEEEVAEDASAIKEERADKKIITHDIS